MLLFLTIMQCFMDTSSTYHQHLGYSEQRTPLIT